ncbi:sugar phosphate isomerase/epimerase [Xylanibacillus composti]|uniref:Inosose dehydratase n=1 Tax=Xylanibacillus composti TaxID=1572762 RepID=A0A8J4M4M1_9BACL|nr:sugar phosphate isomerase/epimerase [Xylanibacillus composti]MDT9723703.1 sugar phosphate isomerase/epimerase [Xylanibacillus composti]GIQ71422.1 inosose dehydratase [Xylanibacillus composti]
MKLGYQTNTWGGVVGHPGGVTSVKDAYYKANGSTEEALRDIASAGYQGVELFDGNVMEYEDKPEELKNLLKSLNLQLVGVYTGANFIYPDILEDEFAKIEKVARFSASLGAEHLVYGGGAVPARALTDEDFRRLADALKRGDEVAKKYNLTASYHPHLGTCVETPEQLDKIMSMTQIALCPDTAHIEAGGGDPVAVIQKYVDRIQYVHFKDWGNGTFQPLGEGHQDFKAMLAALQAANYDGWITIELDSYSNPLKGAEISKQYLKEQLGLG